MQEVAQGMEHQGGGTGNGAPGRWRREWSTKEMAQIMEHQGDGAPWRWSREWSTREVCTDYALNLGTIVTNSQTLTQLKPC